MRQLARTLLILGSVGACERAQPSQPVVDRHESPAVGNIGQTGRGEAYNIGASVPLEDREGAPAVGNIGQTGAPVEQASVAREQSRRERERRVQRAQRAAARPQLPAPVHPAPQPTLAVEIAPQPAVTIERPLVSARERPMTGNVVRGGKSCGDCGARTKGERAMMAFHQGRSASAPLFDGREQPMVGNVVRGGRRGLGPEEKLSNTAIRIAQTEQALREAKTPDQEHQLREKLHGLIRSYIEIEQVIARGSNANYGDDE